MEQYSNGYYLGVVDKNGNRNGGGMYVYSNGDIYLGNWNNGNKNGEGFYAIGSQVTVGEWDDNEIETVFAGAMLEKRSKPVSPSSKKWGYVRTIIIIILLLTALEYIGCIDFKI